MEKESVIYFSRLTPEQSSILATDVRKSRGSVRFLVNPLEAIEWNMEPDQLEELRRHERNMVREVALKRIPTIIFDERWRFDTTQRRLQAGSKPLYFIPELGLNPQVKGGWRKMVDTMKSVGINRILLGGRFLSGTTGGCVGIMKSQLQGDFKVEIRPELTGKYLG